MITTITEELKKELTKNLVIGNGENLPEYIHKGKSGLSCKYDTFIICLRNDSLTVKTVFKGRELTTICSGLRWPYQGCLMLEDIVAKMDDGTKFDRMGLTFKNKKTVFIELFKKNKTVYVCTSKVIKKKIVFSGFLGLNSIILK